ncbi:MAG: hypothetical protein Q4C34_05650 [Bacteroidales bacterium]|nr:hypothetical protein [Bacteroidales bacterium]
MKHIPAMIIALAAASAILPARADGGITDRPRYGTNYTVPFAHAYRALGNLGIDRREAIDRDVYHMSRLGLTAFRLHLWDVELTDSVGNLLDNDHLDLLFYLISSLEQRGIDIVITAQTNFGNGYPERNTDPNGAFSYDYPKCEVHDLPPAQAAQQSYLGQLVTRINPYTGRSLADDPAVIAIEINNEPCHSGDEDHITAYIDRMADTLRSAGWHKDILYNVSHNLWRTRAFYDARIDGTTYQWYPTGLVRGSRRRGNFLPVLDSYDIPFDTIDGYESRSRVIYEYDPADVLDTYLYPAAARTFRKAGFDWITQFAYDPIDMAAYNTEYQTHWLNLAYTPGKAIGMMIAAEVTRRVPSGADYGKYPADTVFGPRREFTVSARRDLAMLNDGTAYWHTNSTADRPADHAQLRSVAAVGSSPIVDTDGLGAYFLDRLDDGRWRLELMPDVIVTRDPFARPSLDRRVAEIIPSAVTMTIDLPGLADSFEYAAVGGDKALTADRRTITVTPGVWILGRDPLAIDPQTPVAGSARRIGEYVAPRPAPVATTLLHTPQGRTAPGTDITVTATVVADHPVDSVVIYPAEVDFWRDDNRLYTMRRTGKYTYTADIPANALKAGPQRYSIVVFDGGEKLTFPGRHKGTPLDWDLQTTPAEAGRLYSVDVAETDAPVTLLAARHDGDGSEISTIPEAWQGISWAWHDRSPRAESMMRLHKDTAAATDHIVITKWVGDIMRGVNPPADARLHLRMGPADGIDSITLGVVDRDGLTRTARVPVAADSTVSVALSGLAPADTWLTPAPYPSFLRRRFSPDTSAFGPLDPADIETVTITVDASSAPLTLDIAGMWIE